MFNIWILVLILLVPEHCSSWGILSLKLVSYKNPESRLFNGECCDTPSWCSVSPCENYFQFCVTSLGSLQPCDLGSNETKVLGDDNFRFPGNGESLGTDLFNPLTYNFSFWQGSTVVVEVWDDDDGHIVGALHDFVDEYTLPLNKARYVYPDSKSSIETTEKLCGKRSCLTVNVTLYCGPKYLVPDCRAYCVSRTDSLGHYDCNYTSGNKQCHEGWYDPFTNCVKFCTPTNDSTGHYNCDRNSGEKLCMHGWTGDNCTKPCHVWPCGQLKTHVFKRPLAGKRTTIISFSTRRTASFWRNIKSSSQSSQFTTLYKFTRVSSGFLIRTLSVTEPKTPLQTMVYSSHPQRFQKSTLQFLSSSSSSSLLSSSPSSLSLSLSTSKAPYSSSPSSSSSSSAAASAFAVTSSLSPSPSSSSQSLSLLRSPMRSLLIASCTLPYHQLSEHATVTADGSSLSPIPTTVYQADGIQIEINYSRKWTTGKEEQIRKELLYKVNEFCSKCLLTCLISPNTFVNRTTFNISEVMTKISNRSNGKAWIQVKIKLPNTQSVSLPSVTGYLPSYLLKDIVLKNEVSLEKSLEIEIVTVKEMAWNQPTPTMKQRSIAMTTIITVKTPIPTPTQGHFKSDFLPYLVVALCLPAVIVIGLALYRRSKLRDIRILPELELSKSEEELITLCLRKSSKPDDSITKTDLVGEFTSSDDDQDISHKHKYLHGF